MTTEFTYDAMAIDGFVRIFRNEFKGEQLLRIKVLDVLTVDDADKLVKSISAAIHDAHREPSK